MASEEKSTLLTKEDFSSDQDVRWCPGCGDYSILAQVKKVLPELGIPKEKIVFVSGIGCSSRFPYYLDTYGIHGIHGRAPAIASGIKLANPDLKVFIVTGDGDGLSIGGNHFIHLCRRNIDVTVLLFNNQIYGLTKGQYSPTSEKGKITKSTPFGSLDNPFNPIKVALAAGASFIARTIDREPKHMVEILKQAAGHKGTSFVEIYQNCNIFNDGVFIRLTDAKQKKDNVIYMENGSPYLFGQENDKVLTLNGLELKIDSFNPDSKDEYIKHNSNNGNDLITFALAELTGKSDYPTAIGVFKQDYQETYDELLIKQTNYVKELKGKGEINKLLYSGNTWEVI